MMQPGSPSPMLAARRTRHRVLTAGFRMSTLALVGGTVLAILAIVAAGLLTWQEVRTATRISLQTLQMKARMIDDQASRAFQASALALSAIADNIAAPDHNDLPKQPGPQLSQALLSLPFVRGIAVLDGDGQILYSTTPTDVGETVPLDKLGQRPKNHRDITIGGLIPGRTLPDLNRADIKPTGISFISVLKRTRTAAQQELLLVALVNPASLSGYQQQLLDGDSESTRSVVAAYDGTVLAGSTRQALMTTLHDSDFFSNRLLERERDTYLSDLPDGDASLVAYRASRLFPVVTIVEQSYQDALGVGLGILEWLAPATIAVVLAILGMSALAWRSMRARERQGVQLSVAYERIADGERALQTLIESVQELIFRTDASGILSFVNGRWKEIGGHCDPVGLHLRQVVLTSDRRHIDEMFNAPDTQSTRSAQVTTRDDDGQPHLLELALVPLRRGDEVIGFAGSAVDISKRVAAEKKVEAQLYFLNLLQEIAPLPISMTDPQGRFLNVNKAWEAFMGRPRDQVLGKRNIDFLPPDEAKVYDIHSECLLREGGSTHYEEIITLPDGTSRHVQVNKVLVPNEDGTPYGLLSVKLDVTAFRQAQALAEEALRSKSEFVANISHELRTPLQSILGFSELGLHRGSAQPQLGLMFQDIHASGQRMLELVNNLLDISKIESTVGTFNFALTDIRRCINTMLKELAPLHVRKGIHVVLQSDCQGLIANVDEVRFQQVVRNVLANAIKFSPEGGHILFNASTVKNAAGRDEIVLQIIDDGPGIPEDELDSIFLPFMQSSRTSGGTGGTGLGLAICRKILDAHGGSITASNQALGGTCFEIRVPATQQCT